jgi:hypothetical protein
MMNLYNSELVTSDRYYIVCRWKCVKKINLQVIFRTPNKLSEHIPRFCLETLFYSVGQTLAG